VQSLFANGVALVELAALREPDRLPEIIARACGVEQGSAADSSDALRRALGPQELLLVLDNFEQLRGAGSELVGLLATAPYVTILVTSRVVLHVSGEHVYPVKPLELDAAVALFCDRARAVDPGFAPDSAALRATAKVCVRLDRLPLAIELAAAHARVLTPIDLHARLDARLPLLTGGPRDLPARQRTLRATLDWSYSLLSPVEQRLLQALAVFAGGFGLPAAEDVCGAQLDTLGALIEHNLLRRLQQGRFDLLETVREFAAERLDASAEASLLRERHAVHFLEVAERAHLRDGDGEQRPDLVLPDLDNVRAGLAWALENDRIELGLEIATALERFWWTNAAAEGTRWFEALVSRADAVTTPILARALRAYGTITVFAGDLLGARPLYEQSLEIYRRLGDDVGVGNALCCLAANAGDQGDVATARQLVEQSLAILERVGSTNDQVMALKILGKVECDEGNHDRGITLLVRAAGLAEATGARFEHAYCLGELCDRAFEAGRFSDAERWGRESVTRSHDLGDRGNELYVLTLLARTALSTGHPRRAGLLWGAVEAEEHRGLPAWWILAPDDSRYSRARTAAPLLDQHDPDFIRARHEVLNAGVDDTITYALAATAPPADQRRLKNDPPL
jgi:predicted ATPase